MQRLSNPFSGSIVALVTPMHTDGRIDWDALCRLIDWHVAQGTHALSVVGTTGESPTLTVQEHCELIRITVMHAAGRIPILAGCGANATQEAIELAQFAKESGANGHLQVVPYYNKPTQEGLYAHFEAIAQAVDLPLVLYNVPGRTVADLANDTVCRLAHQWPQIVGIKDATGDLARGQALIQQVPTDFAVYSGDDVTAVFLMLSGAKGNISVTANVWPQAMAALCTDAMARRVGNALARQKQLFALHQALFVQANPIPVKWAMARMGLIASARLRLPLTSLTPDHQKTLEKILGELELVS
jgi:4-hydroxy-tetrahydrodipicolinate synthase